MTTRLITLAALLVCGSSAAQVQKTAIVCAGTSLTNGYVFDASPYPARLAQAMGVNAVNFGVNGDTLVSIVSRWQKYAKLRLKPYRVLVAEGGTNDLAQGANGATLWATFEAWIEEAQATGLTVVAVKVPPRSDGGWTGAQETQRLAFNAALDAYAATNSALLVVESDTLLGNGGSPVELNPAYRCEDELHLCAAGMQVLANEIASLLE